MRKFPLTLSLPRSHLKFSLLSAMQFSWCSFGEFCIRSLNWNFGLFSSLVSLILYQYWKEKFSLGHSQELKGLFGSVTNEVKGFYFSVFILRLWCFSQWSRPILAKSPESFCHFLFKYSWFFESKKLRRILAEQLWKISPKNFNSR